VSFVGDASVWSRVQHLAPRDATFVAMATHSPPSDLLDTLIALVDTLPAALDPFVAQIEFIQQAHNSQVGTLQGLSKLHPDVIVMPSTGTGFYDAVETEFSDARIVVLQTMSPELVVGGAPVFSSDPVKRFIDRFWSAIEPLLHAVPTLFANSYRQAKGIPLLADNHDYWMQHVNILPVPTSSVTAPNLM
jgi:hypothetical protein